MDAEDHVRRRAGQGCVQGLDIEIDQPVGFGAGLLDLRPNGGIAQKRQRYLVELNVTAAGVGKRGDLLSIDADEVGEEALGRGVGGRVGKIRAAIEVHGRRRR